MLNANPVDTLIIAGDISNNFELTLQAIRRIEAKTGIRCLFIPGNHDLWNEQHPGKNPWQTYRAMQDHPGNLTNGPLSLTQGWLAAILEVGQRRLFRSFWTDNGRLQGRRPDQIQRNSSGCACGGPLDG